MAIGRIPGWMHGASDGGGVHRRGHRRHQRLRRPHPAGDLPLRPRRRAAASPPPRWPSASTCTPTWPATTSTSWPPAGYLEVAVERPEQPGRRPPVEALPVTEPRTCASSSPPGATTCSSPCSAARWPSCPSRRPRPWPRRSGEDYGRSLAASMAPGEGHRSLQVALHAVADALTAHGFAAHTESRERRPGHHLRAVPVRRGRRAAPGDLRRRPGHRQGHAGRRSTATPCPRRRRPAPQGDARLRHARLSRPRWPATTSTTRRRRRPGRRWSRPCCRGCPAPPTRAGCTPRAGMARACGRGRPGAGGGAAGRPAAGGGVHQRGHRGHRRRRLGRGRAGRPHGRAGGRALGGAGRVGPRSEVTEVGVDGLGRVDPDEVLAAIRPGETALVHLQWANHEVGTLQPVAEVVAACRERGVLVHVDAAAAAGHVPDRLRRPRRRPAVGERPQAGRPAGRRAPCSCAGACACGRCWSAASRSGPGGRAWRTWPASSGFGAAAGHPRRPTLDDEAARARAQTEALVAARHGGRRRRGLRRRRPTGCPTSSASAWTAWRPRPCCSASTRPASPPTRAARARRSRSSRRRCWRPWACEAERSLRVSVGWSTTDADVDAFRTAFPGVVGRLRSLGTNW